MGNSLEITHSHTQIFINPALHIAFSTKDIDADYNLLKKNGVEVLSEPVKVTMSENSYSKFFLL